jgi:hypothetical protein
MKPFLSYFLHFEQEILGRTSSLISFGMTLLRLPASLCICPKFYYEAYEITLLSVYLLNFRFLCGSCRIKGKLTLLRSLQL